MSNFFSNVVSAAIGAAVGAGVAYYLQRREWDEGFSVSETVDLSPERGNPPQATAGQENEPDIKGGTP